MRSKKRQLEARHNIPDTADDSVGRRTKVSTPANVLTLPLTEKASRPASQRSLQQCNEFLLPERELAKLTSDYFISGGNNDRVLDLFHTVSKLGLDFKLGKTTKEPVVHYREQSEVMADLLEPIPTKGTDIEELLEETKRRVVRGSVNFSSPGFIAFPDSGNAIASVSGDILSGLLNQNLINSVHTSPTATFVEIAVINWLREIVGFEVNHHPRDTANIGGISVSGGVLANTIGLLLARENRFPRTIKNGISFDTSKVKVFIAHGISHYSSRAALGWLGIGASNMIDVNTTPDFRIDQNDLVRRLEEHKAKGDIPLALVVYAGDSRTMSIDDFPALSEIAKKYGLWLHIDACHGLSLCFTKKLRDQVKGIELADSITTDPHKVLFTPYVLSYVLVRDPSKFELVSGISDLITKEPFSLGRISPFLGSRPFNSLKLWMLIKHLGTDNIGRLIEHRHGMALYLSQLLSQEDDFYVMNRVMINNVAYLYVPKPLKRMLGGAERDRALELINELNARIQHRIFVEGNYYIHTFKLNDFMNIFGLGPETTFQMQRVSIGNPLTTKKVLRAFIKYLRGICEDEYGKLTEEHNLPIR